MNEWYSRQRLVLLAFHWFLKDAVRPVAICFAIYKKKRKGEKKSKKEKEDGRVKSVAGTKRERKTRWTEEAAGSRNIIQ